MATKHLPILASFCDDDFYKFTMRNALTAIDIFIDRVVYKFKNRNSNVKFTAEMVEDIKAEIENIATLIMTDDEYTFLQNYIIGNIKDENFQPFLIEKNSFHQLSKDSVTVFLDNENNLNVEIVGSWVCEIMWEVKLMAIISEIYFRHVDPVTEDDLKFHVDNINDKGRRLESEGIIFCDGGTRRRRSKEMQDITVRELVKYKGFIGTSNVHFAQKYNTNPLGTIAHEFYMGVSGIYGVRRANRIVTDIWASIYKGRFGTALTDTFTTKFFLKTFDGVDARLYDNVRHDSSNPFKYVDMIVDHYNMLGINPLTKTIQFSDSLDVDKALKIRDYCNNKINCRFMLGTNFTNDIPHKTKPLNIVIKMDSIQGRPVVKISDEPTKASGNQEEAKRVLDIINNAVSE
jgi:nicotinate phosphoribosyltransferase